MAIVILSTKTINRIAAGEVIERPASVVKELVENAIDAGSTNIQIKIESGGRNLISIIDDGIGIYKDEIELAFMRHATSKLHNGSNLIEIKHLGFRGEALPSIAAVSRIKLSSKANDAVEAWSISYESGEQTEELTPCPLLHGTCIEVRDLFFTTPNRLKFLKTERAETQYIVDIINNLAMINYHIGFILISENKKLLRYDKQSSLINRLCEIEKEFQNNSLKVQEIEESMQLIGHICKPIVNRSRASMIYTFVNKRPIKDNLLIGAIRYAYHDFIPSDKYPCAVLHLQVPCDQVDVNVHPNKSEVRFQNKRLIYEIVTRGLTKALSARIDLKSHPVSQTFEQRSFHNQLASKQDYILKEGEKNRTEFYETKPKCETKPEYETKSKVISSREVLPNLKAEKLLGEREIQLIEECPLGFACCQVYSTYIIAQAKNSLIIVDQHAAHERLVYEYMKKKSEIKRQKLLFPTVVSIKNQAKIEMIENYKDKLFDMGFDIEIILDSEVRVKEIPMILENTNIQEIIVDVAERLVEMEDTLPIESKINKILATISCHSSIRAGRKMTIEEMNELLRQIEKTPYSGQCNHGRPTYIEMKLSDLEKLFARR